MSIGLLLSFFYYATLPETMIHLIGRVLGKGSMAAGVDAGLYYYVSRGMVATVTLRNRGKVAFAVSC